MKLDKLINGVDVIKTIGKTDIEIDNVQINSNSVNTNSLFICLNGENYDGADFIEEVEKYGALAVITEKELETSITQIIVKNSRLAMSLIAKNFYGNVCDKMKIIGVVGTNGKTTTAHLISKILNGSGINCGVIGTIGIYFGKTYYEPMLTTPDPLNLHKILHEMYLNGYETVVMEVSAHSLYHKKVYGINFEVGVFTNFSRDHLDFFKDIESYKQTKKSFFIENYCKYAVLNADDEVGRELLCQNKKAVSYGIENPADVFAMDVEESLSGTKFILNLFDCVFNVETLLTGYFNVQNVLASSTACALIGAKPIQIVKNLKLVKAISGRIECVYDKKFSVFIDYAHTPDGLEKVILALKKIVKNRIICLFGCGGNRDVGKRVVMGEISGELADFTIITSDNPRYEEPMEIINEIEKGVLAKSKKYVIIQDRREAIEYALNYAKEGDVVLIAGKGSEKYQEILGIKQPYNDKDTVEEILRRK